MKSLFGRKIGMTQVFDEKGLLIPVSVIECEPMTVVQKKSVESHGYNAIQVGFGEVKEKKVNKPLKGHFDKAGVPYKRYLREIRVENPEEFNIGDEIKADTFEAGQFVDVVGTSKGKGTLGVIARHGFGRGRESHGSKFHRMPGGMSASTYPGRVFKGHRMAGKTGHDRVTVQNLTIVRVIPEKNLILVKGAIPGPKKGLVEVKSAVKK